MGTLGNSEAVRAGNAKERQPRSAASPAKETAEARRAQTPERPEARPEPKREPEDEFGARLRRAIPGIKDAEVEGLRKLFDH
jgi:hypothetical protein